MISSRNLWVLIGQLLLLQFLALGILIFIESMIGGGIVVSLVNFLFGTALPAIIVGYAYAMKFGETIPVTDKKKIAICASLFWAIMSLLIKSYHGYENGIFADWENVYTIIIYISLFIAYVAFSYEIIRYFLRFGDSWYLKRH